MNKLELVNAAIMECGVSGGPIVTTLGQTGSIARIISWVGTAWNEIQTEHDDWDWMRSSNILGSGASFVPVAGAFTATLGTGPGTVGITEDTFGKWDRETFRNFTTTVGTQDELFLDEIPYDSWRDSYMYGAMRAVQTRPVAVAVGPNQSVCFGPPSNGLYTITGDYWVAPSAMATDVSTPTGLPLRYHMLIVYKVMKKYAGYESAPEVLSRANDEYTPLFANLEAARLPAISFGGGLGT
jgi:hypothetical protein